MRQRHLAAFAAVAALAAGALAFPAASASADPGSTAPSTVDNPDGRAHTVPLVTGDTVRVEPDGAYVLVPGEGREGIGYQRVTRDGDVYLVPSDAARLQAAGVLDRRVFNVSALLRDGYADGAALPLIVRGVPVQRSLADGGEHLDSLDADAVDVPVPGLAALWNDLQPDRAPASLAADGKRVWLDGKSRVNLDQSVPQVGAPTAWEDGYTGAGVTVAVLDSGYDPTHPDLAGRVAEAKDFTGTSPEAVDGHGHGTHVASTVAGTGAASNGKYKGVAPDAKLLIGKVCTDDGYCTDSDMIEGMEWAAANGAAAANMSIGGYPTDGKDPLSLVVDELTASSGTLFVVASGNFGSPGTVSSPASADAALAVGSVTKTDALSDFSSSGPRVGDGAVKPEIAAPGSAIVAARANGTSMGEPVDEHYTSSDGTSMATPHVTGAVAILKQRHPQWTAARLKAGLTGSAKPLDGIGVFQIGGGRLDVARAVEQSVYAERSTVDFGLFAFPHDQPAKRETVTYANDGDTDVTLNLALGADAPAGLFTVDSSTLLVPAHGTASATVTVHPDSRDASTYGTTLVASTGTVSVRTPVSAYLEEEQYGLEVSFTPREEQPLDRAYVSVYGLDNDTWTGLDFEDGQTTESIRLRPGHYRLIGAAATGGLADTSTFAVDTTVSGPGGRIEFDMAKTSPVKVDLTGTATERLDAGMAEIGFESMGSNVGFVLFFNPGGTLYFGDDPAVGDDLQTGLSLNYLDPGTGTRYQLYDHTAKLPQRYTKAYADTDLYRADSVYESQGVAATGSAGARPRGPWPGTDIMRTARQAVPATVRTFYSPGRWTGYFSLGSFQGTMDEQYADITATAGASRAPMHWNRAPLGPDVNPGEGYLAYLSPTSLTVHPALLSGPDRSMVSSTYGATIGHTEVTVDGRTLISADGFPCIQRKRFEEPVSGRFTIRCELTRTPEDSPYTVLGSHVAVEWNVTSGPVTAETVLDLSAVRLNASGVVNGYAKAGAPQVVGLTVDHSRAESPGTASLSFEVSYDEGKTWRSVPVARYGDNVVAVLIHPKGATSVSTRMSAADTAGNTVKQTVIKSYGLN